MRNGPDVAGLCDLAGLDPVAGDIGFNKVKVTGPGLKASATRFVVGGQLASNQPMAVLGKTAPKMGSSANTRTPRLRGVGTAPVTMQVSKAGANPGVPSACTDVTVASPPAGCRASRSPPELVGLQ